MIPTLFIVAVAVFVMMRAIPGNVVDAMVGEMGPSAGMTLDREAIEKALGLDKPIHEQFLDWIRGIFLHGSLGNSLRSGQPVTDKIISRLPVTIELGALGIIIALLIAFPIGVYSALRQDTIGDYIGRSIAIIFISVPAFWTGTILIIYPSLWWGWVPSLELIRFIDDPWGNLKMFLVPAAILGMLLSGVTMRMIRTMMLEVLRQDYIRTAWSKGLTEKVVVLRHAMKNALAPVVTIIGTEVPVLVAGSVILEQIFVLPGIGRLLVESVEARDYTMVSGINFFVAATVIFINLIVDITYAYLDPRIHYE